MREESERRRLALVDHERDFERLHREEATLRQGIHEQGEHLGRTYAEIERLNALVVAITADREPQDHRDDHEAMEQTLRRGAAIEAMKTTRAWRLHEWWRRIRS